MARPPRTRSGRIQRADAAGEDDPPADSETAGKCGRGADDECGMTDPSECSIHGRKADAPDTDERLRSRNLGDALSRRFVRQQFVHAEAQLPGQPLID